MFVYNRPEHTKKTIESLKKNRLAEQTDIYIYSDGAKNKDVEPLVREVRKYIKEISGFKNVFVVERDRNFGLASNIIDGVTKVVNSFGKVIVLEDDLLTSNNFLCFMNEALDKYENEQKVYAVTGYSFTDNVSDIDSTYFLSITSSWGWGTWSDRWAHFERNSKELEKIILDKDLHYAFNYQNSYNYISMARHQLEGRINSWAIYWYLSIFKQNGLTLFPAKKLLLNIGFDGTGTHCHRKTNRKEELQDYMPIFTEYVIEKNKINNIVVNILKKQKTSIINRLLSKFKRIIEKVIKL